LPIRAVQREVENLHEISLIERSVQGNRAYYRATVIIENCPDTNLYAGYVPAFQGAYSKGATLDEQNKNLREVIQMLLEVGE